MSNNHYKFISDRVEIIAREQKLKKYDAFVYFILREVMDLEESVCEDALQAGGPRDCGLDAFWTDENAVYLLQSKFYSPSNKVKENEIDNFFNVLLYLDGFQKTPPQRCKNTLKKKRLIIENI